MKKNKNSFILAIVVSVSIATIFNYFAINKLNGEILDGVLDIETKIIYENYSEHISIERDNPFEFYTDSASYSITINDESLDINDEDISWCIPGTNMRGKGRTIIVSGEKYKNKQLIVIVDIAYKNNSYKLIGDISTEDIIFDFPDIKTYYM